MRTARRYLAREIYRSCAVVLMALLGLFTFFALVDDLDNVGDKFSMMALLYMQALAIPTRLYDLLPIGLLIGAILALAGLAQRNELVILRVSGVSGMRLLRMLWIVTIPLMIGAALLSEYVTPWAEMKSGEANLMFRGKAGGDRLNSGYWFKEPTANGGTRIINIAALQGGPGAVGGITLTRHKLAQKGDVGVAPLQHPFEAAGHVQAGHAVQGIGRLGGGGWRRGGLVRSNGFAFTRRHIAQQLTQQHRRRMNDGGRAADQRHGHRRLACRRRPRRRGHIQSGD